MQALLLHPRLMNKGQIVENNEDEEMCTTTMYKACRDVVVGMMY
jgi:hypothetical protein